MYGSNWDTNQQKFEPSLVHTKKSRLGKSCFLLQLQVHRAPSHFFKSNWLNYTAPRVGTWIRNLLWRTWGGASYSYQSIKRCNARHTDRACIAWRHGRRLGASKREFGDTTSRVNGTNGKGLSWRSSSPSRIRPHLQAPCPSFPLLGVAFILINSDARCI